MTNDLSLIIMQSQDWLWSVFVVFIRTGAIVSVAPLFGEQSIPVRVKLGVAIAFTLIATPAVAPNVSLNDINLPNAVQFLAPEILTGLFFGIVLRFFVFSLQIAGSMAAQATSLAQIFGGSAGVDPQPAIGHLLVIAGLALAAIMGLHTLLAAYIINSYAIVPVGILIASETVISLGVAEVGRVFALGFCLAAPFLVASLIYNVTLGIINKAMPQLMVSFVGAPAITAGAMLLLVLSAPLMLATWFEALSFFLASPFGPTR
ncbi:flagellar biosynthetic protein FliR [Yoonia sp. 208BN28-4]|uniref:flagellar biosynthetic protein FliR n=1 Tax=Yoonia sp. 208BN28-4 TaxID=3126505 RepID=UPI0030B6EADA